MKKILEKLGYECQVSSWNRDDLNRLTMKYIPHPLFDNGFQMEYIIDENDVWQILVGESQVEIIHCYIGNRSFGIIDFTNKDGNTGINNFKRLMEFERLFLGKINTEEDLVKVMEQVGCPYKK